MNGDHAQLKQEKATNLKQISALQAELENMKTLQSKLEGDLEAMTVEKESTKKYWESSKIEVKALKENLIKYHNLNTKQTEDLEKEMENRRILEEEITNLKSTISSMEETKCSMDTQLKSTEDTVTTLEKVRGENEERIKHFESELESLKTSLSSMKELDQQQKGEIDETNKMMREIQVELKENKKELVEYQNRWQIGRKQNDEAMEQLRGYELKMSNLSHELSMKGSSLDSKNKVCHHVEELKLQRF